MRENFIISSDKNNGYPTFSDAVESGYFRFYSNSGIFQSDGSVYPEYPRIKINTEGVKYYLKYIFFEFPIINDGYPVMLKWYNLSMKSWSDIYSGDKNVRIVYFRNSLVKTVYFRNKAVYRFGYGNT